LVALATFVLSFVSPIDAIQDLRPGDDAACGQTQWFGTHADTRLATQSTAPDAQHCPYCHFLRAVSGASPAAAVAMTAPATPALPASVSAPRVTASDVTHRPSRAPPSGSLI
jgi:hypothetical protein